MKHYLSLAALLLLSSCYNGAEVEESQEEQGKQVQFVIKGLDVDYGSRATLSSEGITDLWVYEDTTMLMHQTSEVASFGAPTITLPYGAHDLTFVASKSEGQTFDTAWVCTKVKDTYAGTINVTVSKGSSASRQVALTRANAKVQWTIEDAIPQTASTIEVSVPTRYGLDKQLKGILPGTATASASITSWRGITNKSIAINVLTQVMNTEENIDATVTIKDTSGTTLCTYTNTIGVLANRVTNIHGSFFNNSSSASVSLNTTWNSQSDVNL